eukprot:139976-Alexandrium_andersonii.AAC.1
MQNHVRHSELELRGPRNSLDIGPPSSRWERSGQSSAKSPNPPTQAGIDGLEAAKSEPSNP